MGKKANTRKVKDNEAMAVARSIRTSPRKLNLVAQMIRGKKASVALNILSFDKHRMAIEVKKVLQSAVANAENNHQLDVDRLVVAEASVGRAFVIKRFHARARGRGAPIEKPFSNIRVVVREEERQAKPEAKAKKSAPKAKAKASTSQKAKKD
ncbi:MAG TPA: 50S ribosomal protein L22 [Alphaproteobacteria bacterium]|nr:50S ribosomal protein L22 [Alphaproteobacteria bacterium]